MAYRQHVFDIAGLDEVEERVYRFLLATPGSTVAAVAKGIGVGRKAVDVAIASLEQKAFVQRSQADAASLVPVPPERAIDEPLRTRLQQIDELRREAIELTERFQDSFRQRHPADIVEAVSGAAEATERWVHLTQAARFEVVTFDRPPYASPPLTQMTTIWDPAVRSRILLSQSALEVPGRYDSILERMDEATTVRVAPTLPMKLKIADRRIALVPLTPSGDTVDGCLVVQESALLDSLIALFEAFWERAIPIEHAMSPGADEEAPTEEDQRILALLATGLTDQAIARALGTSKATAERRTAALARRLGATSRFQLAYLAIQRGWIDPGTNAEDG